MTLMCIKYTDQQDPPDIEVAGRGADKNIHSVYEVWW